MPSPGAQREIQKQDGRRNQQKWAVQTAESIPRLPEVDLAKQECNTTEAYEDADSGRLETDTTRQGAAPTSRAVLRRRDPTLNFLR